MIMMIMIIMMIMMIMIIMMIVSDGGLRESFGFSGLLQVVFLAKTLPRFRILLVYHLIFPQSPPQTYLGCWK